MDHGDVIDAVTGAMDRALARNAAERVADAISAAHWWNVEATITVRLKLRRYTERYGDDADGNRGETRECIEVERQEVTGDHEGLRAFMDAVIRDMDAEELSDRGLVL